MIQYKYLDTVRNYAEDFIDYVELQVSFSLLKHYSKWADDYKMHLSVNEWCEMIVCVVPYNGLV